MSMTPRLWSINGLAVELGIDRRTVAQRLRNVQAAGEAQGHPVWRLDDALSVLKPASRRGAGGSRDSGEDRESPYLEGMRIGHRFTMHGVQPAVAEAAVAAGLGMDEAFALAQA